MLSCTKVGLLLYSCILRMHFLWSQEYWMSIACYYLGAIVWSIRRSSHKHISFKETSRCHQGVQKCFLAKNFISPIKESLWLSVSLPPYLTIRHNNFYAKSEVQCLTKASQWFWNESDGSKSKISKKKPNDQEIVVMRLSWDHVWPLFHYFWVYWPYLSSNLQPFSLFFLWKSIIYIKILFFWFECQWS